MTSKPALGAALFRPTAAPANWSFVARSQHRGGGHLPRRWPKLPSERDA